MSELRIQAKARVQVTIEVEASGWGPDCLISQVYRQAADDGVKQVTRMIAESKCRATLIGQPVVIGVITTEKR